MKLLKLMNRERMKRREERGDKRKGETRKRLQINNNAEKGCGEQ